jgi:SagB-type dehydrogenase family enzyme
MNEDVVPDRLTTSPAVRLRPPSPLTKQQWIAEDILHRTRYALPPCAVLLLVACIGSQERQQLLDDVGARLPVSAAYAAAVLGQLQAEQLVYTEETDELRWFASVRGSFAAHGWPAAADYHLLTYDYDYLDYSLGFAPDADTMRRYSAQESDVHRYKVYDAAEQTALPAPSADLLPAPFAAAWSGSATADLTFDSVAALLSTGLGKLSDLTPSAPGVASLMHRTSPSGGARHPSEAYLAALSVRDMSPGWYHVRVEQPALEKLNCRVDVDELRRVFAGPYRAPFEVRAILAITSVFDRNMYRYREPRTFRTIFMDAGHLTASIEVIGRSLGMKVFAHHGIDDAALEQMLGLHGLQEGAVLGVALG